MEQRKTMDACWQMVAHAQLLAGRPLGGGVLLLVLLMLGWRTGAREHARHVRRACAMLSHPCRCGRTLRPMTIRNFIRTRLCASRRPECPTPATAFPPMCPTPHTVAAPCVFWLRLFVSTRTRRCLVFACRVVPARSLSPSYSRTLPIPPAPLAPTVGPRPCKPPRLVVAFWRPRFRSCGAPPAAGAGSRIRRDCALDGRAVTARALRSSRANPLGAAR